MKSRHFAKVRSVWALVLGIAASGTAIAAPDETPLPATMKVVRLEVQPASINLPHRFAYGQLLITGTTESGDRVDLTRAVTVEAPPSVSVSENGLVRAVADGAGEIKLGYLGQSLVVPVQVSGIAAEYPVSFVRDVMPVMSKLGCNAGTCHGAQDGKNGFKLSLRGYDPLFDHRALTDDHAGRRFNRSAPDHSLMLLKPSGGVPHVGGVLTRAGEPAYELLKLWIAKGVKLDLEAPRVTGIRISPENPVVQLPGMRQQMTVHATYSDGTSRDVTAEAFIDSSLAEVVETDKTGLVTAVRRGEAAILARYEGSYAATTIIVMDDRSGFTWQDQPSHGFIDDLAYDKMRRVKVLPSGLCNDAEFIRRVYLDLTGLPPEPSQVTAFLADSRDQRVKREELIDLLVGSPAYVEHWTNKWSDMLTVNRKFLSEKGAWAFRNWIRQAVAGNMPYDKFAYAILTGSGSTFENPPAAYLRVLREPDLAVENSTQLFLAVRFNCNKCHDHPFERWTQDQYYQLGAYFAQIGRKPGPSPEEEVIFDSGAGEVTHARTGKISPPKFPFEHDDKAPESASRREQFARWCTSPKNVYFAKSYVNRLWSYLLGAGFIEPVDDIRAGNPPSNPQLLDRLTEDFIASGFDVQHVVRTICKSRTYQLGLDTNRWNEDDSINYSHAQARRLSAEVLFDAVHQVTGATRRLPGVPVGFRAAETADPLSQLPDGFLELFGRPPRESACECERSGGVILGQALNLINGPTIAGAIADPGNRIAALARDESDDARLVQALFMAILSRPATEKEVQQGIAALHGFEEELKAATDALAKYEAEQLTAGFEKWAKSATGAPSWSPLELIEAKSAGGATLTAQKDGSLLVTGPNPSPESYTVTYRTKLTGITGLRLEALADDALPSRGPGRAGNGNFVLSELRVTAAPAANAAAAKEVKLQNASASFSQESWHVAQAIDGNNQTGWAVHPQPGKDHIAVFETAEGVGAEGETILTVTMLQEFPGRDHNLGKFRLSATTAPRPVKLEGNSYPADVAAALAVPHDQRTAEQLASLLAYYKTQEPSYLELKTEVDTLQQQAPLARLRGAQDLSWALINSPAFLFNH